MRKTIKHDGRKNWRMAVAFFIAGKELYDWRSKHNRIVAKMATSYTEGRIIKRLEVLWQKTQGTHIPAVVALDEAIRQIKAECQDCEKGRCEPHYIPPKSYIIKGEQK